MPTTIQLLLWLASILIVVGVTLWIVWRPQTGVSIPVAVDAVRQVDERSMVRATYFIVSSGRPSPDWSVHLVPYRPAVGVLGETGVIFQPHRWSKRFRSAEQIDRLFDTIERHPDLSVDIEDLWIPVDWLGGRAPARGDVYRLPLPVFAGAFRFRDGEIGIESFLKTEGIGSISSSDGETAAFRAWAADQIDASRANYEQTKAQALRWEESS